MRTEYDFCDSKPNPYARKSKKQITIRIDEDSLEYFKRVAVELGIPYQNLINSYLRDCMTHKRKPSVRWAA